MTPRRETVAGTAGEAEGCDCGRAVFAVGQVTIPIARITFAAHAYYLAIPVAFARFTSIDWVARLVQTLLIIAAVTAVRQRAQLIRTLYHEITWTSGVISAGCADFYLTRPLGARVVALLSFTIGVLCARRACPIRCAIDRCTLGGIRASYP